MKSINWKYALGEVMLICIGITAAIWFNNWNESRQAKKVERESLIEIKSELAADTADLSISKQLQQS